MGEIGIIVRNPESCNTPHYNVLMKCLNNPKVFCVTDVINSPKVLIGMEKLFYVSDTCEAIDFVRNIIFDSGINKVVYIKSDTEIWKFFDDKNLVANFLSTNNFKQQQTYLYKDKKLDKDLKYPFVIKKNKGSGGEEVHLISNQEDEFWALNEYDVRDLLIQHYNPNSFGRDVRVIVFSDRIFYYRRTSNGETFKSNIGSGGTRELMGALSDEWVGEILRLQRLLVEKLKKSDFHKEYFAIDVYDEDEFNIIEINYNPGLGFYEELTGLSVEGFGKHLTEYFNQYGN